MAQPLSHSQSMEDRRTVRRYAVDCAAQLRMVGGILNGRLTDLSERGARFEGPTLPTVGAGGMLSWAGEDHFCEVIWARDGKCGVVFERPIAFALVAAHTTEVEVELGPVANFGNIPLGQKRSRRLSLVSE